MLREEQENNLLIENRVLTNGTITFHQAMFLNLSSLTAVNAMPNIGLYRVDLSEPAENDLRDIVRLSQMNAYPKWDTES